MVETASTRSRLLDQGDETVSMAQFHWPVRVLGGVEMAPVEHWNHLAKSSQKLPIPWSHPRPTGSESQVVIFKFVSGKATGAPTLIPNIPKATCFLSYMEETLPSQSFRLFFFPGCWRRLLKMDSAISKAMWKTLWNQGNNYIRTNDFGNQNFFSMNEYGSPQDFLPPQSCHLFPNCSLPLHCFLPLLGEASLHPLLPFHPPEAQFPEVKAGGRSLSNAMSLKSYSKFIMVLKTKNNSVVMGWGTGWNGWRGLRGTNFWLQNK